MTYPEALHYLYSLGNEIQTAKLGLERIRAVLEALGNPQNSYRTVHVAGTNGKGSTCAMIEAGLRAAGAGLVIRRGPWVPTVIRAAREAGVTAIHVADDVSGYAQGRLARLEQAAGRQRMAVIRHPGVTIVPPGAVRPAGGAAFRVFTPYYRRWLSAARRPPG